MNNPRTLLKVLLLCLAVTFVLACVHVIDGPFLLLVPVLALAYAATLASSVARGRAAQR